MDDHVASLLETLDEQGLRDNTVVVVTADHGDMLGEPGLWYKMAPFEPSIRVPLIFAGAGVGRALRVAELVSLLDLAPTLVELGGGAADDADGLDGRSLAGAVRGDPLAARDVPLEYLAEAFGRRR